jgi:hypothetical protein
MDFSDHILKTFGSVEYENQTYEFTNHSLSVSVTSSASSCN